MSEIVDASVPRAVPSGHALMVCRSPQLRLVRLATWTSDGLRAGEQVLLTGLSTTSFHDLLQTLATGADVDVPGTLSAGDLRLLEPEEFYPETGQESLVTRALGQGYSGLRLFAPSDAALTHMSATEYDRVEAQTAVLCARHPLSALCQYDDELSDTTAHRAYAHHNIVIDEAAIVVTRVAQVDGGLSRGQLVELAGEFDLTSSELLRRVVARAALRAGPGGGLDVDAAGLRFLSVAAARSLVEASARLRDHGGQVRIQGLTEPMHEICRLLGLHRLPGFDIEESR